jgi:hypothetical protein
MRGHGITRAPNGRRISLRPLKPVDVLQVKEACSDLGTVTLLGATLHGSSPARVGPRSLSVDQICVCVCGPRGRVPIPKNVTFLESAFPFAAVSRLVDADRRSPDPAYQAHRWWARRPPALLRSVLVAAALPGYVPEAEFWSAYGSEAQPLAGMVVKDPFLGGGTTLVEAARLGAVVAGSDVDPLAVMISEHQLRPARAADVVAAGEDLIKHLSSRLRRYWPAVVDPDGSRWEPLHYFTVAEVTCPACALVGPLYRSLVIGRSVGHPGSVVRDVAVTAFCPACFGVHDVPAGRKTIVCCGRRHSLTSATFRGTRYQCPGCGTRSSHTALQTGAAPRRLIAVEDTPVRPPGTRAGHRRIRAPRPSDKAAISAAARWAPMQGTALPTGLPLTPGIGDRRPVSYGVETVGDLHTARQVAYLSEALAWIEDSGLEPDVVRALRLAVSTTITCNNRLCGYATDYGRLAPLFSVRAFSLPWLTVELNPLNPTGGRGTLAAALARVARSCEDTVRRNTFPVTGEGEAAVVGGKPVAVDLTLLRARDGHVLRCADAVGGELSELSESPGESDGRALADVCITDPPYFDFISYDTLSQVFRAWLTGDGLAGEALLPAGTDPVSDFGRGLGAALRTALHECKPESLVAFTYKGDPDAWEAVGIALDEAKLRVTALWPVLADPHMGHHTHEGNCEYDVLVVCRPLTEVQVLPDEATEASHLIDALRAHRRVSAADTENLTTALQMASTRRGVYAGGSVTPSAG